METIHEAMLATKAVEYVMSAGFLALFLLFWQILNRRPRKH